MHPLLRRTLRELARSGLDLLLPPHCAACGQSGDGLCPACRAHLRPRPAPACRRCGEPLLSALAPCSADHRPLRGLRFAQAPYRYAGTAGAMVRRLKFTGDRGALLWLGRAMAGVLGPHLRGEFRRALLVPVPLHRRRRRIRGLDQAALIAAEVGRRLRCPAAPGLLARTRPTLPQGDPRVGSRERNVAGAFALRRPAAIAGRAVVLVDDVLTSGATLRECAAVLSGGGAAVVAAVTAARA